MSKTTPLSEEMRDFYSIAPEVIPNWPAGMTVQGFSAGVFKAVARSDWKEHDDRIVKHWDWWKWHETFRTHPTRFECAVFLNGALMGLILGILRPAAPEEPKRIEVWYLESRPGAHTLKGQMLFLLLDCAYYFGIAVEAEEVRIVEPLPEVIRLYEAMNFRTVKNGDTPLYCSKPCLP